MTGLQTLNSAIDEAVEAEIRFLDHCSIFYKDINANSEIFFIGWHSWRWRPLEHEAQRPLGLARAAVDRAHDLLVRAVRASEQGRLESIEARWSLLTRILDQDDGLAGAPGKSIDEVVEKVRSAGAAVKEAIAALPTAHGPGGLLLVPDTNALIFEPDLTAWANQQPATIVIVPEVTRELDQLKMRESGVAPKAQKLINQLNEFDRRGDTRSGVRVAGALSIREIASVPDFDAAPATLDRGLADDRVLASAIELGWEDLNAEVVVVTRDRNMKNRARLVSLAYSDAEDIVGTRAAA